MLCPICKIDLQITERANVEIDYCTKCRGIWLDRSELDKIIEQLATTEQSDRKNGQSNRRDNQENDDNDDNQGGRGSGFLGNLFDLGSGN